jgi:hypothetical protein
MASGEGSELLLHVRIWVAVELFGFGTVVASIFATICNVPNTMFCLGDQRQQFLPFLAERYVVFSTSGEHTTGIVAVK